MSILINKNTRVICRLHGQAGTFTPSSASPTVPRWSAASRRVAVARSTSVSVFDTVRDRREDRRGCDDDYVPAAFAADAIIERPTPASPRSCALRGIP